MEWSVFLYNRYKGIKTYIHIFWVENVDMGEKNNEQPRIKKSWNIKKKIEIEKKIVKNK